MTDTMRRVSTTVLLLAGWLATGAIHLPAPAWACSCVAQTDAERFGDAAAVFTGTALSSVAGDPVVFTFDVEAVMKGQASSLQEVRVPLSEVEGCRFNFEVGERYQVFAGRQGPHLYTWICSGTRQLSAGRTAYVPGESAPPGAPADSPSGGEPDTPAAPATPVAAWEQVREAGKTAALVLGFAVGAFLLGMLVGRRGRPGPGDAGGRDTPGPS